MAAETLQKIMSAALDMKNMLINMGVSEPKLQQETPLLDLPRPKPIREALLKLKVRKETVNKLDQIYTSRTNEYRSETMRELQIFWRSLHVEGSHTSVRAWEKVLFLSQRKTQETLDDLFDMVISRARDHVANLSTKKRKSQPVFDQVSIKTLYFQSLIGLQRIIDFLLWYFAGPGGSQNPSRDEKKKLAVSTGLTYKQVDIWVSLCSFPAPGCLAKAFPVPKPSGEDEKEDGPNWNHRPSRGSRQPETTRFRQSPRSDTRDALQEVRR